VPATCLVTGYVCVTGLFWAGRGAPQWWMVRGMRVCVWAVGQMAAGIQGVPAAAWTRTSNMFLPARVAVAM
jgi:hypothetical protein